MSVITIKIRDGRTEEEVYADTALLHGYQAEIVTTEEKQELDQPADWEAPEGAYDIVKKPAEDGSFVSITYKVDVKTPNPMTNIEFGRYAVARKFAEQDVELEGNATKLRAKAGYNI